MLAGVLLGLGVAAKLYPVLLLGALFLLCLRAGRLRTWGGRRSRRCVAWLAVNVPVALLAPDNWSWFFVFSQQRPANPETIWNIALHLSDQRSSTAGSPRGSRRRCSTPSSPSSSSCWPRGSPG